MSRPCFALSVMLCCLAGPLLIIGKAQARDSVVSPSHDPGECIVCPLAHGSPEVCGGYSDYDYNQYWHESPPTATLQPPVQSDPEIEVAQTPTGDSASGAWGAEYEDYYADYVFGDESTTATDEDLTLEETPNPAALIADATETASATEETQDAATSELDDKYESSSDGNTASDDYFDAYDEYEPITATEAEPVTVDAVAPQEGTADYEAYEEEWFAYGSETTLETNPAIDEADEALSESEGESNSSEISDARISAETWGDEEEWYHQKFGYDGNLGEEAASGSASLGSEEQLETGYDESYDAAMASQPEVTEPIAETVPASADYERFYDAYDDLYNFGAASLETSENGPSEAEVESVVEESGEQTLGSEPAWLTDLVTRMLAPVWTATGRIASEQWTFVLDTRATIDVDQCAQEWDYEADYWAQPQADQPSLVLDAADTLDGMASLLRSAAEALRGFANRDIEEMARKTGGNSPR